MTLKPINETRKHGIFNAKRGWSAKRHNKIYIVFAWMIFRIVWFCIVPMNFTTQTISASAPKSVFLRRIRDRKIENRFRGSTTTNKKSAHLTAEKNDPSAGIFPASSYNGSMPHAAALSSQRRAAACVSYPQYALRPQRSESLWLDFTSLHTRVVIEKFQYIEVQLLIEV